MAIEAHQTNETESQPGAFSRAGSWVADVAADAWHASAGGARVAGHFALGMAEEAYEHPGRTALQIGAGALAAGAAAEAGITAVGAAAIAAVPLAGYGLYRGAVIASTEGVGAIPSHIDQSYSEAKSALASAGQAIASVYRGGDPISDQKVEAMGRAAIPFTAGAVGGAGGELGQMAIRGGAKGLGALAETTLPSLSIEPALVTGALRQSASASTATGSEAAALGTTAANAQANVLRRDDGDSTAGQSQGEGSSLEPDRKHNLFVDGRVTVGGAASDSGEASLSNAFRNVFNHADDILKNGGRAGNVELTREGDLTTARIVAGEKEGAYAIYSEKQGTFVMEMSRTSSVAEAALH